MADLCRWKIRFKVILIDWESFDDILMHFNDQIREKTWWINARKMLIRKIQQKISQCVMAYHVQKSNFGYPEALEYNLVFLATIAAFVAFTTLKIQNTGFP